MKDKRDKLIKMLISEGWLKTKRVIDVFKKVPRENFVVEKYSDYAYVNEPLPIMHGQTISQPLTVGVMTEALDVRPGQKILEIGAGSGYQAAILSELVGKKGKVVTIERIFELAEFARQNLSKCGYKNVEVVLGDGSLGCEKEAPYNRIIVTASSPKIPEPLVEQLKVGGKMVIPVGDQMFVIEKIAEPDGSVKIKKSFIGYYVFVPLIGEFGYKG